jgi:hypothetical protein
MLPKIMHEMLPTFTAAIYPAIRELRIMLTGVLVQEVARIEGKAFIR